VINHCLSKHTVKINEFSLGSISFAFFLAIWSPVVASKTQIIEWWLPLSLIAGVLSLTFVRYLFITSILLTGCYFALFQYTDIFKLVHPFMIYSDAPVKSDAVVVLSATATSDGRLSPRALERLIGGVELMQQELASNFVVTTLPPHISSPKADIERLVKLMNLKQYIEKVGPAYTTFDEIRFVKGLIKEKNWRHVLIVTSPYHSARVRSLLTYCGVEGRVIVAPDRTFSLGNFVNTSERIQLAYRTAYEGLAWVKFLFRAPSC
jgi:uncharacterized SAM-binding protein YcdF (DUF218 family)